MRRFFSIAGLLLALTTAGAAGIRLLTGRSWLESSYLAVITLTTLGSEDVARGDPWAMFFVMMYLVCGLSIFTYSAFQIGQLIVNAEIRGMLERRRMDRQIKTLEDHFIICGMGRMGMAICEYLAERQRPFVIIDRDLPRLEEIAQEHDWLYLHGDATDDEVLVQAGIERARALATVLATDADNVYVVLSARMLSADAQIIARSSDDAAVQKLERAGASRVISPFSSGAVKMARFMLNPSIEDFLEITDARGSELELADVQIREGSPYIGMKLAETDLSRKGVMVIGIRRASGERLLPPSGNAMIHVGDSLFAFGSSAAVNAMIGEQEI
ncbi:Voltage-gated potassium channel Kch [Maioricimonas rarisocia]|uniref:Voltage-gated potassium channel Kch n=1 Tax=Maioricimonas rarisocia TaxID=2528026 RepID=A0A517Z0C5_9PLAN|nr:potassium channel protein [Maioricimonas rarisocia]QDU35903.1 Voltage-gated potassium channel Kch [Maioricimonas rarisocia]